MPSKPGYQASSDGRVRSQYVTLKAHVNRTGHLLVNPSVNGKQTPVGVHRLVCEAFHGPCPEDYECGHLDGDPTNNKPENLRWITRLENQRHRALHGTTNRGERNGRAKLTDAQMLEIRRRALSGEKYKTIAAEFGVCRSHISNIATGRRAKVSLSI